MKTEELKGASSWLTASEEAERPQSYNHKELNSAKSKNEFRSRFSPEAPDKNSAWFVGIALSR